MVWALSSTERKRGDSNGCAERKAASDKRDKYIDIQGFLGISEQVRRGFQNININCRVRGDATKERLEDICRLAQQHSPVFDIVTNKVPVTVRTEVL